jgi:hypothetical protein
MSQDSPPGRRLGPYSYLSTFLQRIVSGEDIGLMKPFFIINKKSVMEQLTYSGPIIGKFFRDSGVSQHTCRLAPWSSKR